MNYVRIIALIVSIIWLLLSFTGMGILSQQQIKYNNDVNDIENKMNNYKDYSEKIPLLSDMKKSKDIKNWNIFYIVLTCLSAIAAILFIYLNFIHQIVINKIMT